MRFEADLKVGQVAEAFANDFVELGRSRYGAQLDFTVDSIAEVDRIAADLVATKPRIPILRRGFAEKMDRFSKMLGFYVAETLRRSWGAEHGWVWANGQRFYGARLDDGTLCWPVGRAQQRLAGDASSDFRSYLAGLRTGGPSAGAADE